MRIATMVMSIVHGSNATTGCLGQRAARRAEVVVLSWRRLIPVMALPARFYIICTQGVFHRHLLVTCNEMRGLKHVCSRKPR